MSQRTLSSIVKAFKIITIFIGSAFIFLSATILIESVASFGDLSTAVFSDNVEIVASMAALISGITLVSIAPESFRVKFLRPPIRPQIKPTYGFTTLLAIGIGATIGSPLFIILPVNIVQYAFVSIISLIIAGSLSYLISRIYAMMFSYTLANNIDVVGGPGFVRISTRERSLRYFIARFSMWIANTALAAFSAIFLFTFTFLTLPGILSGLGLSSDWRYVLETLIISLFGVWFVINAFFERRFLKTIGYAQIFMIAIIIALLLFQGFSLGFAGSWNLGGFFSVNLDSIPLEILENTGYLFILFFGFQEIQAMVRESKEFSSIPLISRVFKLGEMPKEKYFPLSMGLTVLVSLAIMVFNAVTIYSVHPSLAGMGSATIPALFVVSHYIGPDFQIVTLTAFLLATITTFVPAFIAASRHLRSLSEEGFFPRSIKNSSWIFTVLLIAVLSLTKPDFLVNITDFMVLIALGLIALSPVWLRKISLKLPRRGIAIALTGSVASFFIDILLYPQNPDVVLLGVIAVVLSFMMYDVISTGTIGLQIFVFFFDVAAFLFESIFPSSLLISYPAFLGPLAGRLIIPGQDLSVVLLLSAFSVLINLIMDVFVIRRTSYRSSG